MAAEQGRPARPTRPALARGAAILVAALAAGCLSPSPAPESAPSPPPPPEAPAAAAPAKPLEEPAPVAPAPSTDGPAPEAEPVLAPARRSAEAKPKPGARPASKARSRAGDDADREIGSAGLAAEGADALRSQLERADRAATPDCPAARERKKAVCDLAGQICRLTDRDPNVASVAEYCADAKQRCTDAERRTAARCPD